MKEREDQQRERKSRGEREGEENGNRNEKTKKIYKKKNIGNNKKARLEMT